MNGRNLEEELYNKHFRVTIFGSARLTKDDPEYKEIYSLTKLIGKENIDVVTGGGPGLMDAACAGHHQGRCDETTQTIGLNIIIPSNQKPNRHLDIKSDFDRFSNRLDMFMMLSNIVVVAPGGIGTLLEFLYTWQLVQVKQICNIPIILLGEQWKHFLKWVEDFPLKRGLLSQRDFDRLFLANSYNDAYRVIKKFHDGYLRGDDICLNFKKYKIDYEKEG